MIAEPCRFCFDRPWELFNAAVDDFSPVSCPCCGRRSDELPPEGSPEREGLRLRAEQTFATCVSDVPRRR